MRYRLTQNLGTADAASLDAFGVSIKTASIGDVIELPDKAAEFLRKKYPSLLEPVENITGLAKPAALHGTPEKATEDLKRYKEKGTVKSDE